MKKIIFLMFTMFVNIGCTDNYMDCLNLSTASIQQNELDNNDYYYYQHQKIALTKSNKSFYVYKVEGNQQHKVSYITTYKNQTAPNKKHAASSLDKNSLNAQTPSLYLEKVNNNIQITNCQNDKENVDSKIIYQSPTFITEDGKEFTVSPYVYVKIKSEKDTVMLKKYAKQFSLSITKQIPYMPMWYELSCINNQEIGAIEIAQKIYETGCFEFCTPDFIGDKQLDSNDPLYKDQWGLKNTGQYEGNPGIDIAYEDAQTLADGYGIKIGVVDCGVDYSHPDLQTAPISYDAKTGETLYGSSRIYVVDNNEHNSAHGTECAGIINGNLNKIGIRGVAPLSTIYSISLSFYDVANSTLASGISWATSHNLDVISCSWGGGSPNDLLTDAINNACKNGRNGKGCVVIFSAGNNNKNSVLYPSSLSNVICVGAMDMFGKRKNINCIYESSWGSNYGSGLSVVAPGIRITTTDISGTKGANAGSTYNFLGYIDYEDNNYTRCFNGTSAAAPFVAGIASLILEKRPDLTSKEVKGIIQSTCNKLPYYFSNGVQTLEDGTWNNEVGYGLVNAFNAVSKAINLNSNYKIQGETIISKSGNTFSFTNVPTGAYVTWSVSDNQNFTAIQTSYNTVLVRANSTGKTTTLTGTLRNAQNTPITSLAISITSSF